MPFVNAFRPPNTFRLLRSVIKPQSFRCRQERIHPHFVAQLTATEPGAQKTYQLFRLDLRDARKAKQTVVRHPFWASQI